MELKKNSGRLFHEEYLINSFPADNPEAGIYIQAYFNSCFSPGYRLNHKNVDFAVYALILDGSYNVVKKSARESLSAGDFGIVFPPEERGEEYTLSVTGKRPLLRKAISVRRNAFHDWLISRMFNGRGRKIHLRQPERVEAIMDEMRDAMSGDAGCDQPRLGGIFYHLLQELQVQYREKHLPDGLREAVNFIGQNYCRSALSRAEIADSAAISVRTLSRMFKDHFGAGVAEYVISLRLDQAYALLQHSNLRIKEIASGCGFRNSGFMTRQFKAKYGTTPREYRRLAGGDEGK